MSALVRITLLSAYGKALAPKINNHPGHNEAYHMTSPESALALVQRHLLKSPAHRVLVEGRHAFTLHQAEKRIRDFYAEPSKNWHCSPTNPSGLPLSPASRGCGHRWHDPMEPMNCPECLNPLALIIPA